jgi:hypothetical protein
MFRWLNPPLRRPRLSPGYVTFLRNFAILARMLVAEPALEDDRQLGAAGSRQPSCDAKPVGSEYDTEFVVLEHVGLLRSRIVNVSGEGIGCCPCVCRWIDGTHALDIDAEIAGANVSPIRFRERYTRRRRREAQTRGEYRTGIIVAIGWHAIG